MVVKRPSSVDILLMVQKSGQPPGMVLKPCEKKWEFYYNQLVLAGFLKHQAYDDNGETLKLRCWKWAVHDNQLASYSG